MHQIPFDVCYMGSGLHGSVSRNFTLATVVTIPQACGTRQATLFLALQISASTMVSSMAQPTALLPGAINMLGGRAPLLTTANIWPATPSVVHFLTQPPALLPGSYIMPGGRAPLSTSANLRPTATMPRTMTQLPALLPGSYIKPGGKATFSTNMSLPYSRLVPTMTHAMTLPSSLLYARLYARDGWAISSEGAELQLSHLNVTSGEWLFLLL